MGESERAISKVSLKTASGWAVLFDAIDFKDRVLYEVAPSFTLTPAGYVLPDGSIEAFIGCPATPGTVVWARVDDTPQALTDRPQSEDDPRVGHQSPEVPHG